MLRLYGFPRTRTLRALWTLEEAEADYAFVRVDFFTGQHAAPPYSAMNPMGKVPTLVDGDLVVTESAAICTYVADRHPASGLAPEPRTAERARFDQWCFFVATELEQPLWTMAKHRFVLPEDKRVPAIMETAAWEFARAMPVLEAGLGGGDFLLGDRLTVPDILAAHTLSWAIGSGVEIGSAAVDAYARRLLERPAFARAEARKPDIASPAEAAEAPA